MATKTIYVVEFKGSNPSWSPSADGAPWTGKEFALEEALRLSNESLNLTYRVTAYVSTREDYA